MSNARHFFGCGFIGPGRDPMCKLQRLPDCPPCSTTGRTVSSMGQRIRQNTVGIVQAFRIGFRTGCQWAQQEASDKHCAGMERLPIPHDVPRYALHTAGNIGQIPLGTKGVCKPRYFLTNALQFRLQLHKLLLFRSGEDSLCFQLLNRSLYSGALPFKRSRFIIQRFITALHPAAANLFRQAGLVIPLNLPGFQLQLFTASRHFPLFIPKHRYHFHIQLFLMGKCIKTLPGKLAVQRSFVALADSLCSGVLQWGSWIMLNHGPGNRGRSTYVVGTHGNSGERIICRHNFIAGIYGSGTRCALPNIKGNLTDLDAIDGQGIRNPLQLIPPNPTTRRFSAL